MTGIGFELNFYYSLQQICGAAKYSRNGTVVLLLDGDVAGHAAAVRVEAIVKKWLLQQLEVQKTELPLFSGEKQMNNKQKEELTMGFNNVAIPVDEDIDSVIATALHGINGNQKLNQSFSGAISDMSLVVRIANMSCISDYVNNKLSSSLQHRGLKAIHQTPTSFLFKDCGDVCQILANDKTLAQEAILHAISLSRVVTL